MNQTDLYKMGLSLIPNVGPITCRKLVAYVGSIEGVFKEKKSSLLKVPGVGKIILQSLNRDSILKIAETELNYIEEKGHKWLFYLDKDYPARLKECEDAPIVLFYKGRNYFNESKIVSIVGTRRSTEIGHANCEKFVLELAELFPEVVVVSGFAYGIDICAHKASFKAGAKTLAVLGNGIDMVYPTSHQKYVKHVQENGAFISEFTCRRKPDPGNFVSRNRIIAGLADATLVIESGIKGGALITADMANSYNRDVFAFPGRVGDKVSAGCNNLVKQNKAALIESATDMVQFLRWESTKNKKPVQKTLFMKLDENETLILDLLQQHPVMELDRLAHEANLPISKVSATLLNLEFKGLVRALPGKSFKAI